LRKEETLNIQRRKNESIVTKLGYLFTRPSQFNIKNFLKIAEKMQGKVEWLSNLQYEELIREC